MFEWTNKQTGFQKVVCLFKNCVGDLSYVTGTCSVLLSVTARNSKNRTWRGLKTAQNIEISRKSFTVRWTQKMIFWLIHSIQRESLRTSKMKKALLISPFYWKEDLLCIILDAADSRKIFLLLLLHHFKELIILPFLSLYVVLASSRIVLWVH